MEQDSSPKMGTVAVILAFDGGNGALSAGASTSPAEAVEWVETFSDEREISALEEAIQEGNPFPLQSVYAFRERAEKEDEEFGDYVEDLLCQKVARPEVQSHGMAWLRSKLKIDHFRQQEKDAAEVIAHFALSKYRENPELEDFVLAGPGVQVRVRIFKVRLSPGVSVSAA
jgi:hypothetical protein